MSSPPHPPWFNHPNNIQTQKTSTWIFTAVKISNPAQIMPLLVSQSKSSQTGMECNHWPNAESNHDLCWLMQ
jgi:hypothetical protein